MPPLIFPIVADGLLVDVLIGLDGKTTSALHASGRPIPNPIRTHGLLDTGSDITAIRLPILQQLGIPVQYQTTTQSVACLLAVNLYKVSLSITNLGHSTASLVVQPDLLVMELSIALKNIDVLIGLDVLLKGKMLLDGPSRLFTLDFGDS